MGEQIPAAVGPAMITTWQTASAMAEETARELAVAITEAVAARGAASLALAGGSTPVSTYRALDRMNLPWRHVHLVATDERWVPGYHELSNERMFRLALPNAFSSGARLFSLAGDERAPEAGLEDLIADFQAVPAPLDAVLLGMGADGHVASLFPDDPAIDALFDSPAPLGVARPPSQPTARISLTPAVLSNARSVTLLLAGSDKRRVVEAALAGTDELPAGRLLRRCAAPVTIHWTP